MTGQQRAQRLRREVALWGADMHALLDACRLLVAYYGSKRELKSWDAAIAAPLERVSDVVAQLSGNGRAAKSTPPHGRGVAFRCSEATAKIVSPLVEIVGGPVAAFVFTIRKIFPPEEQSRLIVPYGFFVVSLAEAVTQPLWETYRHLAPEEWKAIFPARPDNTALQSDGRVGRSTPSRVRR